MKLLCVLLTAAGLCVSVPVLSEESTKDVPKAEPEKVICRSSSKTGSIIAKRECHTAAVWKELSTATTNVSEQALDKLKSTRVLRDSDF